MPRVVVPPPYRGPTQGTHEIDVDGDTVLACLEAVDRKYPGFLELVVSSDGDVHRFVKIFRNGDQLEEPLSASVDDADEIEILAAIAGG